jgi:hypothetical protein
VGGSGPGAWSFKKRQGAPKTGRERGSRRPERGRERGSGTLPLKGPDRGGATLRQPCFHQLMDMPMPCLHSHWARHLGAPDQGFQSGGKESQMIALRFPMITHFPACRAAITSFLERLSSAT